VGERFAVKGGAGERRWGGLRVEAPPAPAAATVNSGPSRHRAVSTSRCRSSSRSTPPSSSSCEGRPPPSAAARRCFLARGCTRWGVEEEEQEDGRHNNGITRALSCTRWGWRRGWARAVSPTCPRTTRIRSGATAAPLPLPGADSFVHRRSFLERVGLERRQHPSGPDRVGRHVFRHSQASRAV